MKFLSGREPDFFVDGDVKVQRSFARVAELADAPDLGSGAFGLRGSSPLSRTIYFIYDYNVFVFDSQPSRPRPHKEAAACGVVNPKFPNGCQVA